MNVSAIGVTGGTGGTAGPTSRTASIAIVEIFLGVEAARKPLEAVARPINAVRGRLPRRREVPAEA
jgi:hypothetical protein